MSSYDYNDLNKTMPIKRVVDQRMKRIAQVYKEAETNTDPHPERNPRHQQEPPAPPEEHQQQGMMITQDVLNELNKALYHLQQVVFKLGGGQ